MGVCGSKKGSTAVQEGHRDSLESNASRGLGESSYWSASMVDNEGVDIIENPNSLSFELPDLEAQLEGLGLSCIGVSVLGGKGPGDKVNQDYALITGPVTLAGKKHLIVAVYDGHGKEGHICSKHCAHTIATLFDSEGSAAGEAAPEDLDAVLNDYFVSAHGALCSAMPRQARFSGTTATVVVMGEVHNVIAHCGDSRCIKSTRRGSQCWMGLSLTPDHQPDDDDEAKRIESCGGKVQLLREGGVKRACRLDEDGAVTGVSLAVARSLGDSSMKEFGVVCTPQVRKLRLKEEDAALIIASDGLWGEMSNREVSDMCEACFDQGKSAAQTANQLCETARAKWEKTEGPGGYRDDISVIVIFLPLTLVPRASADADGAPTP